MTRIQTIATLFIRVFAVSWFVSALVEVGIVILDFVFVRTGIYLRSEIAFVPRIMYAAFATIAAAYLFYQSKPLIDLITKGLDEYEEYDELDENAEEAQRKGD